MKYKPDQLIIYDSYGGITSWHCTGLKLPQSWQECHPQAFRKQHRVSYDCAESHQNHRYQAQLGFR